MNLKAELQKMDISNLKFVCKELGVSGNGSKHILIDRLLQPLNKKYKLSSSHFQMKHVKNNNQEIIIYTWKTCPYCIETKELLTKHNKKYTEKAVRDDDGEWNHKLKIEMEQKTGKTSVPQIFIDGKHIGGLSELEIILKKNK
tara:strand:- start:1148 stop:1576 length:429 start_codon:yes stop_codon:yes gene_type:complete